MFEPNPGALAAGQVFHGRYQIVRCLKAGGMGAVYECIHLKTRKHRALKVMLPQVVALAGMRDRFELEARATATIESEHIVETFDAGVDDATGAPFLVMELLRGEDLASTLQKRGALSAGETIILLSQAALALDKTHAAGIVHRDLKPDNLYVTTRDDGSPRLKILDFGIAKVIADVNQTAQQTAVIGTPLYMPPEQILGDGNIGPRADVYAMGHIAFALLTGKAYWFDEQKVTPALYTFLGKVMQGAIEPATARAARRGVALPPAFDAWFARATARAASARFERVSALIHDLAVVLGVSPPRLGAVDFAPPNSRAPTPLLASSTAPLAGPPPGARSFGPPVPTVSEVPTSVALSKSVASTFKRSRLLVAVVGLGALGLLAAGLWSRTSTPTARPATPFTGAANSPIAATSASDPESAPTLSVAPRSPSSIDVPTATAAIRAPDPTAASTSEVPTAAPAQAPPRPKPALAKPVVSAKVCDPPYVTDTSGHRVMKPQCL